MKEIELGQIDTRYEGLRLKDRRAEEELLISILEYGIREPLLCMVHPGAVFVLLDGFKRLRCAAKLNIANAPIHSLGDTESAAILELLRVSNCQRLSILEQAALVDELQKTHGLSLSEIARQLDRSPAWVSVRLGLMAGMSQIVKQEVFGGRFPVRVYMYTLRPFTRVKGKKGRVEVDAFVPAVSGREFSVRDIDFLWQSYITGGPELREQILKGNLDWTLAQLKRQVQNDSAGSNETEVKTLKDLDWVKRYILKIPYELKGPGLSGPVFFERAQVLISGILGGMNLFKKALEDFLCLRKTEEKP